MQYRSELDGLRAIAVLPVILFHAGMPLFSGGFAGVDIFFVISGYLITAVILAELEVGRFSLVNFYERRARRILPALFLVMAVCLPFAWLWLMPKELREFSKSLVATLGFASNVFFSRHSDYFDSTAELKPLLHTWSLGVEEQFYVIFPIVLLLAWRLKRQWLVMLLVIVTLLSLALAQHGAGVNPVPTFFLLPTRGWELAMGSLVAFYLRNRAQDKEHGQFHPALSQVLSLVGLGLIVYSLVVFDEATPFPSVYALAPTVGAGLVIVFALPDTFVGRLLGGKCLVGVGLVSYSAYLWHQPLFAFARHGSLTEPHNLVLALAVVLTFCLAYVTWRYVERPFRNRAIISNTMLWRSVLASGVVLASFSIGLLLTPSESSRKLSAETQQLYRRYTCFFELEQTHETLLQNDCHRAQASSVQTDLEPPQPAKRYVLYGDSLAAHLYPGLSEVVGESEFIQLTGGSCSALRSVRTKRCQDFHDWFVGEYVPNNAVDGILVSSWWLHEYIKLGEEEFRVQCNHLFKRLKGNRVIIYSQVASLSADVLKYIHKLERFGYGTPSHLEMETEDLSVVNAVLAEESAKFGFEFIDASRVFCSRGTCVVGKDGGLYFMDKMHLTLSGSILLAEAISRDLLHHKGM